MMLRAWHSQFNGASMGRPRVPSPGFGCQIRTEPVSDPNPNPRRPIRSESEPRAETDPNPNSGGKRSEPRIRTQTPPNASHLAVAGTGIRISVKVQFRRKWRALPYREPAWNQKRMANIKKGAHTSTLSTMDTYDATIA